MYKLNTRIEDSTGYINVVLFGIVMQKLLGVAGFELTIEEDYMNEYILPPIIEQQIGHSKIFMLYFRTCGALIDAIIVKILMMTKVYHHHHRRHLHRHQLLL